MNLLTAIDNLYKVFMPYTVLGNIRDRSCDCCVSDEEIKELLSKQLKELNKDDIRHFMTSATTTFGDVNDYKHFLPRILELTTDFDVLDDFLTFEKLNYSNWELWKEEEIEAIKSFFTALLYHNLKIEDISVFELHDVISLSIRYLGVNKTLNIWKNNLSDNHIKFFVEYKLDNNKYLNFDNLNLNIFDRWLTSSEILNKIEELFFKTKDIIEANRISIAYTMYENEK